jgi:hypothetical protein
MQVIQKNYLTLLPFIAGVAMANFLFWEEKFGVNCLLFAIFWIGTLVWLFPESLKTRAFWATAVGAIISAIMVTWHNSEAAKFAFIISMSTAAGFAQMTEIRFLWHAFVQYLFNMTAVPRLFFRSLRSNDPNVKVKSGMSKWIGMSILPLFLVAVFYIFYYFANDKFAAISDKFWGEFFKLLSFDISFSHIFYVVFLGFLVGAGFWKAKNYISERSIGSPDFLERSRVEIRYDDGSPYRVQPTFSFLSLKKEYQQSLITLVMLNILLLVVNFTDIAYVWFGLEETAINNLKKYVHEGTYILITSILMAMGVLFYIYRKNLNFYPKIRVLRLLSIAWLVQNAILAFSVGIRNWHYLDYHGLAYKRIGVFLFLGLVFFGLVSLWFKIRDKHTNNWVIRTNAWAVYALLLINSLVPWDQFITRYNLDNTFKGNIDIYWLVYTVSSKNIHILEENKDRIKNHPSNPFKGSDDLETVIKAKRARFENENANYSWKSWNFADAEAK